MDYQKSKSATMNKVLVFGICLLLAMPGVPLIFAETSGQGSFNVSAVVSEGMAPEIPSVAGTAIILVNLMPPDISEIEITELARNSVRIRWKTSELCVAQINYGETLDYGQTHKGGDFSTEHSVFLDNLLRETIYHFEITAIDRDGNRKSAQDQTFQTLPLPDINAPANVSDFQAISGESQIRLVWQNPPDTDFKAVAITRSQEFYLSEPDEGTLVYDGKENLFIDTGLTNGQRYYYTIFSHDEYGNYASGAISSAIPRALAAPDVPIEIFPPAVPPEFVPPEIKKLELQDFDFTQDFQKIAFDQEIKIKAKEKEPITISIDYEKVPEVLKTMMVTLKTTGAGTGEKEKFFSFLLKIDGEKTKYKATIIPPELGLYSLTLTNLDYKNQAIKTVFGELEIEKIEEIGKTEEIEETEAQTVGTGVIAESMKTKYSASIYAYILYTYIYMYVHVAVFLAIIIFLFWKMRVLYKKRKMRITNSELQRRE